MSHQQLRIVWLNYPELRHIWLNISNSDIPNSRLLKCQKFWGPWGSDHRHTKVIMKKCMNALLQDSEYPSNDPVQDSSIYIHYITILSMPFGFASEVGLQRLEPPSKFS